MNQDEAAPSRYVDGLTRGDVEQLLGCFAPGGRVWHNFDEIDLDASTLRESFAQLFEMLPERRFTITGRYAADNGCAWQFLFEGRNKAGAAIRIPGCWVFKLRDGLIARVEEYLDSAQVAKMAG